MRLQYLLPLSLCLISPRAVRGQSPDLHPARVGGDFIWFTPFEPVPWRTLADSLQPAIDFDHPDSAFVRDHIGFLDTLPSFAFPAPLRPSQRNTTYLVLGDTGAAVLPAVDLYVLATWLLDQTGTRATTLILRGELRVHKPHVTSGIGRPGFAMRAIPQGVPSHQQLPFRTADTTTLVALTPFDHPRYLTFGRGPGALPGPHTQNGPVVTGFRAILFRWPDAEEWLLVHWNGADCSDMASLYRVTVGVEFLANNPGDCLGP